MLILVFACQCDECGHVWLSEFSYPGQCAKCKSHNWNAIGRRRRLDKVLAEHRIYVAKLPKGTDFTDYNSHKELAAICHAAVHVALKIGALTKPTTCSKCQTEYMPYQIVAHHPDYAKPLEIEWLCCSCHRIGHGSKQEAPAAKITYERDEYSQI